jgi:hypothetical protein
MVPRTAGALRALDGEREPDVTPAAHPRSRWRPILPRSLHLPVAVTDGRIVSFAVSAVQARRSGPDSQIDGRTGSGPGWYAALRRRPLVRPFPFDRDAGRHG